MPLCLYLVLRLFAPDAEKNELTLVDFVSGKVESTYFALTLVDFVSEKVERTYFGSKNIALLFFLKLEIQSALIPELVWVVWAVADETSEQDELCFENKKAEGSLLSLLSHVAIAC